MMDVIENTPPSPLRRRSKCNIERSPFHSERKRKLFPTSSPRTSDLSEITPLSPLEENYSPSKSKVVVRTPLIPTNININNTPRKSKNQIALSSPRRSPRLQEKQIIKTSSFYGRSLLSEFSKTEPKISSVKTKLFDEDERKSSKRPASDVLSSHPSKRKCSSKQRKSGMFAGVHHGIRKPKPQKPPSHKRKSFPLRQSIKNSYDFSKTPYAIKKDDLNWNYAHVHRERKELDDSEGRKRKFFKSTVDKISVVPSPTNHKKCKLFKVKCDELLANPEVSASDLLDLIEGKEKFDDLTESASNLSIDDVVKDAENDRILVAESIKILDAENSLLPDIDDNVMINRDNGSMFNDENSNPIDGNCSLTLSLDLSPSLNVVDSPAPNAKENETSNSSNPIPNVFPVFNFNKQSSKSPVVKSHTPARPPKKIWRGVGENQLLIDAGQKKFGATQCAECGLVYDAGVAEEEIQHSTYHSTYKSLRYPGYKNERIVGRYGLDYIVCFTGLESKANLDKVNKVLKIVDKELGFDAPLVKIMSKTQVYLYISDKRITGCLVAEPMGSAYKLLVCDESDVDVCSIETYPVKCGISRIWTLSSNRRQGVATKLMDCVRRNFFYGSILAQNDIAFSVPSVDGKKFARKYMGKPDYYVYTGW